MRMSTPVPSEISGFVLAGGRSTRMGRDKALIPLAGKPLIEHAVTKLRRICAEVSILSSNPALAAFAPLVPDIHPGCGPIAGMAAALAHSVFDWNLFLPVDVPFLPTAFLDHWVRTTLATEKRGARIAMFTIDALPQPALCLLHRDAQPFITQAVEWQELGLYAALEHAGRELAARQGVRLGRCFVNAQWSREQRFTIKPNRLGPQQQPWCLVNETQQSAQPLWFLNLNTPEDLSLAEANAAALDT